jgi:hypothetical protein
LLNKLEILSLDLSRCSDLILGSLNHAFLEGHFEGSRACHSQYLSWVWLLSASSRHIHYRLEGILDVLGCNGAPAMGDPPTWWIDNAYTKFVSFLADWLARYFPDMTWETPAEFDAFIGLHFDEIIFDFLSSEGALRARCGDDELCFADQLRNIFTLMIYPLIGGKVSEGTNARSNEYGVYCEAQVKRGHCGDPLSVADWIDILRIRSFTRPDFENLGKVPPYWLWGVSISNTIEWYSQSSANFALACKLSSLIYFPEIEKIFGYGINAYAPTCLGGTSFPASDSRIWSRSTRRQRDFYSAVSVIEAPVPIEVFDALADIASAISCGVDNNEHTIEDSKWIKDTVTQWNETGEIVDIQEIVFSKGKSIEDWPYSSWLKADTMSFQGDDGKQVTYIPVRVAISNLRQRLLVNRGLCYRTRPTKDLPRTPEKYAADKVNVAMALVTAFSHDQGNAPLTEEQMLNGGCLSLAKERIAVLTNNRWISQDIVEITLPLKAKPITVVL